MNLNHKLKKLIEYQYFAILFDGGYIIIKQINGEIKNDFIK